MSMMKRGRLRRWPHYLFDLRPRQHRLGRAGRSYDDVSGHERAIESRPGDSLCVEPRGEAFGRLQRAARDRHLPDLLRLQVNGRELGHFAGPEDQDSKAGELAENLLRQRDGRVADRDGALAETGLGTDTLPDGERGVKEPVEE